MIARKAPAGFPLRIGKPEAIPFRRGATPGGYFAFAGSRPLTSEG